MNSTNNTIQKVLEDDGASLDQMLKGLRKFQDRFCENMTAGRDFTVRLEVHGNKGNVCHVRCYLDEIERS
jgi:hypothetical protein